MQARAAADRADRAVAAADAPLGPLHGVPVTIKENVDQEGCATTNGVVAFRDLIAPADCPAVANLKSAGAIIIGRTNTPAFSFRIDTVNDLRGRTYNPWSKTHTPGGSSGGAASSVAAGITPLAHGTDIAGSIRFPAYACGIAGIRPSFGRVPSYNPTQAAERSLSSQLMSVQGPLARTVADLRVGLAAMAARDARDPWWVPAPLAGPPPPQPMRVAVVTSADDLAGSKLHPHVSAAIANAARWLADAGYEIVDERTPGFTRAQELWFEMQLPEFREYMLPLIEKEGDQGIRTAVRFMLENLPSRDALPYMKALAERARLVREWTAFLDRVPLVLAPVSSVPVYEQGFDVESAARTAAGVARMRDLDGDTGARIAGGGRADRHCGRLADRRATDSTALSRRLVPRRGGRDRGARRRANTDRSPMVNSASTHAMLQRVAASATPALFA